MSDFEFGRKAVVNACVAACLAMASGLSVEAAQAEAKTPAAVVQKQSVSAARVQLPDGRWLEAGGASKAESMAAIVGADGKRVPLVAKLSVARQGHSLTLLADGRVLVLGGVSADGAAVASAEVFDSATQSFSTLAPTGLSARVGAAVALLPDGRVLVSGGADSRGAVIGDAEVWDPKTNTVQRSALRNPAAGVAQTAALLPTGGVLLQGGQDAAGKPLAAQVFDSREQRFVAVEGAQASAWLQGLEGAQAPAVQGSSPAAEATGVDGEQPLSVSFNKRLEPGSLNEQSVTLIGPNGAEAVKVVAVEHGVMAWVWPARPLLPGSRYTLFVNGAADTHGARLPLTAIGFDTRALHTGGTAPTVMTAPIPQAPQGGRAKGYKAELDEAALAAMRADDEMFVPEPGHYDGGWISGKAKLARLNPPKREAVRQAMYGRADYLEQVLQDKAKAQGIDGQALKTALAVPARERDAAPEATQALLRKVKLSWADVAKPMPVAQAAGSCTVCVAGQVLRLNGKPLANVTMRLGGQVTRTDDNGEFVLQGAKPGKHVLEIDGSTANRADAQYGQSSYQVSLLADKMTALPFPVWMPKLDTAHAIRLDAPTKTAVALTHPLLPGLKITLPAGTVVRDAAGKVVTQVSITPVPADQPTVQLPYVGVSTFFTLQPAGATFVGVDGKPRAATVQYPNYTKFGPGHGFRLFDYDPQGRGWYVYSEAKVSKSQPQLLEASAPKELQLYRFQPASGVATGPNPPPPPPPCDGGNPPPGGGGGGGGGGKNGSSSGGGMCPAGGDPVGMLSGEFSHTERDLFIDDVQPLDVTRTYRSRDTNTYGFGIGATHRYDIRIVDAPTDINPDTGQSRTNVYVVMPNGRAVLFHGAINALFQPYVNTDAMGEFRGARIEAAAADWVLYFRDGRKWTFTNLYGKLIAMEDEIGNRVSVLRANDNAPIDRVVSPHGRYINFSYNVDGLISRIEDNAGRSFQYGYDGLRLTTVTDPNSKSHGFVWDTVANRITKVLDAYQVAQTTNEYDATTGWVKKQTLADNSTFEFAPTIDQATGLATQVDITDRRGKVRRIVVGPEGFVTQSIFPLGDVDEQTTRYEYKNGMLSAVVDALNRRTEYTYNANGNVETVIRLAGTAHPVSTTTTWDPVFNKPRTYTDANKHKTTFDYFPNGQLKSVTDALNQVVAKFGYDADTAQLKTATNALNKVTTYNYDGADLSSMVDPLKRTYSLGHDSVGRIWSASDPLGNTTYMEWTPLNRLKTITDPLKGTAEFVYDDNGFNIQQLDQKRNPRQFKPTPIGTLDTMTDALNNSESRLYEPGGKLRQLIDRNGQLSAVTYDSLGRAKVMSFGATAAKPTAFRSQVELTWDKGNRLRVIEDRICGTPQTNLNCSVVASKRVIKRSYNDLDQMTQEVTPQAEVNYTYDDAGRRLTMFVRNGAPGSQVDQPLISYTWDDADRLRQIEQAAGAVNGNVKQVIKLDPDNAGRRLKTTLSNGSTMNYTWDDANQLKAIVFKKADGTVIGDLSYGYDGAGRRTSVGGSMARMNLPTAEVAGQYDANNRLKQWGGATFQYDNNGNLLSDGSLTYAWDERNQLKSISNGATEQASFQYDADGRRTSKTIGATTTGYVYDGQNFVQELNGTSNASSIRAQLITGALDETFLRMEGSVLASLLTDANNNTVRLTDGSQAKLLDYTYEPYGTTSTDGSNGNRQQFTGRENDNPGNADGLYYYRARYYMPGCMRFISEDPIGWASGQTNNYAYVAGDPISSRDPSGLRSLSECEKFVLGPYIPKVDLDNADIHDGEVPWYLDKDMDGITRGNDIYFRPGVYDPRTAAGIALLGHELVHVGQYRNGMNWFNYLVASRNGYRNNPYEVAAYDLQAKIGVEVAAANEGEYVCAP